MDIFNNSERQIICVSNNEINFGHQEDPSVLTVGARYTFEKAEVYSWHTMVTLQEFPGKRFNSVHFEEVE